MNDFLSKLQPFAVNAMRIMVGLALWSHGGQKLFAWFGREEPVALMSRFGAAGVIEFFVGAMVVLGIYHRPAAFLISGHMAVTYSWMHVAGRGSLGWWANRGELPLVYCFVFLLIAAYGAGDFSIDGWLAKRRAQTA
jgi:putative oxidoreductase